MPAHYLNQACVDDGAGGAAQACDDVTTPGSKNPHLPSPRTRPRPSFDAVGDVIHYSITATNDGNTTLADVTVTDAERRRPGLHPGQRLAAGPGRVDRPARRRHTITQADIDAGHFLNQACVDDGAGGAAQACDDVTTPGVQEPALTITKDVDRARTTTRSVRRHPLLDHGDQRRQHDARRR